MTNILRLLAAGLIWAVALAAPASADKECQDKFVTKSGQRFVSRSLGAYPSSLAAWRAAVKDKVGDGWQAWRNAAERKVDCRQSTVAGKKRWVCTRTARPCRTALTEALADPTEAIAKAECQSDQLKSFGRRRASEAKAQEEAEFGWYLDTKKKLGEEWADFDNARDSDVDCFKKGSKHQCVATGTPCKSKS